MGRMTGIAASLSAALLLGGCTIPLVATVATIPGTLFEGLFYTFEGEEHSLPVSSSLALLSAQKAFARMALPLDLIEPRKDGYLIDFRNGNLSGGIMLRSYADRLTMIRTHVGGSSMRIASIEASILEVIKYEALKSGYGETFDATPYRILYERPLEGASPVGWLLVDSMLHSAKIGSRGWYAVRMPSGAIGFWRDEVHNPSRS